MPQGNKALQLNIMINITKQNLLRPTVTIYNTITTYPFLKNKQSFIMRVSYTFCKQITNPPKI